MNHHTENKIKEEIHDFFEKATPDLCEDIQKDCVPQQKAPAEAQPKRRHVLRNVLAAAACMALLVTGTGVYFYETAFKTETTISLDVNPGIQMNLNKKEEVLSIVPTNQDGEQLLHNLDFQGDNLENAVDAVVGQMLQSGYLGENANSVLVTVSGKDPERSRDLQNRVFKEIDSVMENRGVPAAVLSQKAASDTEVTALAEKYGISMGKAQLILEYTRENPRYTAGDLAGLTVNELNLLIQSSGTTMKETDSYGQASEKNYIGFEKALEIALNHFGKTEAEVRNLEQELETEQGILVYEIEFEVGNTEYSADIHAVSGKIEKSEVQEDHEEPDETIPGEAQLIGEAEAKKIALTYEGLTEASVKNLTAELEQENGVFLYSVEFETDTMEYEVEVRAESGEILHAEKEPLDPEEEIHAPTESQTLIGKEKAGQIALSYAGVRPEDAENLICELETEDHMAVYEVEFEADGWEYSVEIRAEDGTVLDFEKED